MKFVSIAVLLFSLSVMAQEVRHGFKLIKEEPLKEMSARGLLFEHVKTGARLVYISNQDTNKFFTITFRTPPHDDTGVPHILEHSVLCGSKKYPVKDPFAELNKGSLKTYLNAFTSSDHTAYIFGSTNDRDFMNMMDVYLDAVFYPLIYEDPLILKQEGWRLEVDPKTKKANYNGIVYSEMKGVYSDPEAALWYELSKVLLPHTVYRFESGGNPEHITDLTQKQFANFHKLYYHPSNSYIFLYGNGAIDEHLEMLDGVLKGFNKQVVKAEIPLETKFKGPARKVVDFPMTAKDKVENKTLISVTYIIGENQDAELSTGLRILGRILADMEGSPLKRALKEAGIGDEVRVDVENSLRQNLVSIVAKNADEKKIPEFEKVVNKELKKLAQGIDKDLLRAAMNMEEFAIRELDSDAKTKGAKLNRLVTRSWIHGSDPFIHLKFDNLLGEIRAKSEKGYFEDLLKKYFIKNKMVALVSVVPKAGLAEKKDKILEKKLEKIVAKMSDRQISDLQKQNEELLKKQKTPNRQEDLLKLPFLQLKDISKNVEDYPTDVQKVSGLKVLKHDLNTNGIVYLNAYFDLNGVPEEYIQLTPVLAYLIGKIDTQSYSFSELSKRISIDTGGISGEIALLEDFVSTEAYYPRLIVRGKSMKDQFPQFINLLNEVLFKEKFEDKARIVELMKELRTGLEQKVLQDGHYYAAQRAFSYSMTSRRFLDRVDGVGFILFLGDLIARMEKEPDKVIAELQNTAKYIFQKQNALLSLTSPNETLKAINSDLEKFITSFSDESISKKTWALKFQERNEAFEIPSKVNYVAEAFDFRDQKVASKGTLMVMTQLLNLDYLWDKVRVENGAYGGFGMLAPQGAIALVSYRDPQVADTYKVYEGAGAFLKGYTSEARDHDRVIISTIARIDMPLSSKDKGMRADEDYIIHRTWDDRKKMRDAALATSIEQLKESSVYFEKGKRGKAALITADKAKTSANLFETIKPLIK